jgi:hypothetical protein
LIRVIKNKRYRSGLQIVLLIAFYTITIVPQMWKPFGSASGTLGWWSITWLTAVMAFCLATDVFHRPIAQRALWIAVAVVFYLGAMWPLLRWPGYHLVRIDESNVVRARFSWACMRAWAASFNSVSL